MSFGGVGVVVAIGFTTGFNFQVSRREPEVSQKSMAAKTEEPQGPEKAPQP